MNLENVINSAVLIKFSINILILNLTVKYIHTGILNSSVFSILLILFGHENLIEEYRHLCASIIAF